MNNKFIPSLDGWDFNFRASKCNDAGTYFAGGASSGVTLAGLLGFTGVGFPVAIMATVKVGTMGAGYIFLLLH